MVPTWLERQHRLTRPDRVMVLTEYDARITAALGLSAGSLYLVARRLLLAECGDSPQEGVTHELSVSVREFADRLGTGFTWLGDRINGQRWYLYRAQGTPSVRRSDVDGRFVGRAPGKIALYGLPPLLPADQVAVYEALRAKVRIGEAPSALAAVRALTDLARGGWVALTEQLLTTPPRLASSPQPEHPVGNGPLPLLAIVQRAAGIAPNRTSLELIQATLELRAALRGTRTEVPVYVIDHWLPEIGSLKFWVLLEALRECQAHRTDQADLAFSTLSSRLGVSRPTLYRLVADIDDLQNGFGAWASSLTAIKGRLSLRGVAYAPEMVPLALVHAGAIDLAEAGSLDLEVLNREPGRSETEPRSQNRTSEPALGLQSRTSDGSPNLKTVHRQRATESQNRTSGVTKSLKTTHRANVSEYAGSAGHGAHSGDLRLNSEQEEKSHFNNESMDDFLVWQPYWPAMQGHAKLQRNRQVRDKAGRALPQWVATVLAQMMSGMQDPVTLAVDAFDPITSARTLPYACLELGERGPLVTAQVLSRLAWPDLAWPTDPDLTRIEHGLLELGAPTFRQAPADFALGAIRLLAISQLAERLRKEVTSLNGYQHETPVMETELETRPDAAESKLQAVWRRAVAQLRLELQPATAEAWFAHAELYEVDEGVYVVNVPTQSLADTLSHRARGMVTRVLKVTTGQAELTVRFEAIMRPGDSVGHRSA